MSIFGAVKRAVRKLGKAAKADVRKLKGFGKTRRKRGRGRRRRH